MLELMIVLTALEVLLVLAVLAVYLTQVRESLGRTARVLGYTAFGVRAIEKQSDAIAPGVERINGLLAHIADAAPRLAEGVQRLPRA